MEIQHYSVNSGAVLPPGQISFCNFKEDSVRKLLPVDI